MPGSRLAPEPTIARIALYLRCLRAAHTGGVRTLSSADIETRTGISSGQVRKDLSYFGEFGKPGLGYDVAALGDRLARILRMDRVQPVMLVGAGNLGTALAGYAGLRGDDFRLAAVFDSDPAKIGTRLGELEILDVARMGEANADLGIRVGIISTPGHAAQSVADGMVRHGVRAILNFAPARVSVPPGAVVRNVDLTQELQMLCYYLPGEANGTKG